MLLSTCGLLQALRPLSPETSIGYSVASTIIQVRSIFSVCPCSGRGMQWMWLGLRTQTIHRCMSEYVHCCPQQYTDAAPNIPVGQLLLCFVGRALWSGKSVAAVIVVAGECRRLARRQLSSYEIHPLTFEQAKSGKKSSGNELNAN